MVKFKQLKKLIKRIQIFYNEIKKNENHEHRKNFSKNQNG